MFPNMILGIYVKKQPEQMDVYVILAYQSHQVNPKCSLPFYTNTKGLIFYIHQIIMLLNMLIDIKISKIFNLCCSTQIIIKRERYFSLLKNDF